MAHRRGLRAAHDPARCASEIERFERIFSLYRPDSEISRLNAAGRLARPSPELRALVEESQRIGALSGGAFDISVQPLWRLYEAHFWSHTDVADGHRGARARRCARSSWISAASTAARRDRLRARRHGASRSTASRKATSPTRSPTCLRNEGFESAVVDLGEFRTLGRHPDGRPWRLGIRNGTAAGDVDRTVELDDMALAVSGGYGTTFEPSGRFHHIFDPHTGASANALVDVAVIGPRATAANGLVDRDLRRRRGARADAARGLSRNAGDPDARGRELGNRHGGRSGHGLRRDRFQRPGLQGTALVLPCKAKN